ncbi:hypothetical protein NC652_003150 [Populus alba x Populus x berolinensis]|nr:hypothetical protein NC652_003150 [Populus alba x Populus x berolinensis]
MHNFHALKKNRGQNTKLYTAAAVSRDWLIHTAPNFTEACSLFAYKKH